MTLLSYITKSAGWITGAAIAAGIGYWLGRDHEHRDRLDDQDSEHHADIEFAAPGPVGGGFRDGGPPTPPTPPAAAAATQQQTVQVHAPARMNQTSLRAERELIREHERAEGRR